MTTQLYPVLQELRLSGVNSTYVKAFQNADDDGLWDKYQINTPLRIANFFAQILHESGGLRILRENMSYSASRIVEVFGVNKHSAAITSKEAPGLAKNPEALAERVYGLGNPKKAKELGNVVKGDAYMYRGGGPLQNTGGKAFKDIGDYMGVDLYHNPNLISDSRYTLYGAIWFWDKNKLNALADKNDIRAITRRVNGGYNGYDDRVAYFNKVWKIVNRNAGSTIPAWEAGKLNPETKKLQEALNELGANPKLLEDGKFGPATERAVRAFQSTNGLRVDGIPGSSTWATIELRLSATSVTPNSATTEAPTTAPEKSGVSLLTLSAIGDQVISKVQEVKDMVGTTPYVQEVLAVAAVVGLGLIIYGLVRKYLHRNTPIVE